MEDYDPIKAYEADSKIQKECAEFEIYEIDEILPRLDDFGLNQKDLFVIYSALIRAKMSYELEDSFQYQAAKNEAATIIMKDYELTPQKKATRVLKIYKLNRANKPNLNNFERDYHCLINHAGLLIGLGHAVGLATGKAQAERIAKACVDRRIKPKFLKSKEDVIRHLAKIYRYQSYEACYKALQRHGIKGLPSTWGIPR